MAQARAYGRRRSVKAAAKVSLLAVLAFLGSGGANEAAPMRALSLDPPTLTLPAPAFGRYTARVCRVGVNTVGLAAGRLDWSYFRWQGNADAWSNEVVTQERDFIAEALAAVQRCPQITHVSAVVDVFAPRYLESHPHEAAFSADGERLDYQASTVALVEGAFGDRLLEMIDYLAATYPVQSVSLTELFYYEEGFGADDLASYMAFSGAQDWPRLRSGDIDIDAASVGSWRSVMISRFVARAAAVVARHDKELLVDVRVAWGDLDDYARKFGQDYGLLLEHADRLVLWTYFGLEDYEPSYIREIADSLADLSADYGSERFILSFGLWDRTRPVLPPAELQAALREAQASSLPHVWVTPSSLFAAEHWRQLAKVWTGP